MSSVVCPNCGNEFSSRGIGNHWRQSNCEQPNLTQYQEDIITGLLMGDGCIDERKSGSILTVGMINKPFLEFVDDELGLCSTGVRLRDTASESAQRDRESGFRENAKAKNYHDVYVLRSRTLSELNQFLGWYKTGEKIFPEIELNPTIAKMWYCSDGGLSAGERGRNQAQIRCRMQANNIQRISRMFDSIGFNPTITNNKTRLSFTSDETEKLLDWMGEAPPGFQYKWESSSQEQYKREKEKIFKELDRM